jgi:uncharacterized protein
MSSRWYGRTGPFITLHSGGRYYPLDFRIEDIDIHDIAYGLSATMRFGGHADPMYSVAEHSIHVASLLKGTEHEAWGLLHDASEAYLGDIPYPIKSLPEMSGYRDREENVQRLIAHRFELVWPIPEEVHRADRQMLVTEMQHLFKKVPPLSPIYHDIPPANIKPIGMVGTAAARGFNQYFNALVHDGTIKG